MRAVRHFMPLALILLLLAVMAGCWDRRDLEERVPVLAIAIDMPEEEDQQAEAQPRYMVSVQIPIPMHIAGGTEGSEGAESVKVMSATGDSINQALDHLQKRLNQEIFLGHARVLVISEEVARDDIEDIIDSLRRNPQVRRLLWLLVSKGKALDVLHVSTELEQVPIIYIMHLIEYGANMGEIPDIKLGDFFTLLSTQATQPLANYIQVNQNDVTWKGVALFKNAEMVGVLNDLQTWTLMHLQSSGAGGHFLVMLDDDNERKISLQPENVITDTQIEPSGEKIKVHYRVEMEAEAKENYSDRSLNDPAVLNEVAKKAEEQLEKNARELIELLQKTYRLDALNLGLKMKAYHYKTWTRLSWDKVFPEVEIDITYEVLIRRTGMQLQDH